MGFGPDTDLTPLLDGLNSPGGLRLTGTLLAQYPQLTQRLGLLLGNDGSSTRLIVALDGNPYDRHALDVIRTIDDTAGTALAGTALTGAHIDVGGPSAFYADMRQLSNDDFRVIVAVIIGAIFVVLALLLRSLVAPFYLLASVVLSYAATMGITVVVFQGILGDPGITFWLAPFLFVVLVALGADYNIFIMSRIREEADAGHEIHDAVTRGLTLTGRVITSAGIILAGTFGALIIAPLPNLRQIGFGIGVGILIDTFLVRSLIVPAATMLLGRWAFWPSIPVPAGATPIPTRRPHLGLAGIAIAALAAILITIAVTGGGAPPVTVVAANAQPAATPAATAATPSTAGTTTPSTALGAAPAVGADTTAPTAPATAATAPTAPTAAAPLASGPTRIAIPTEGRWTYHLTGTKRLLGGQPEPIDEQSPTDITRTGGTDESPELRLYTSNTTYTRDDTRRFTPDGVELLATTFSASGASFGGTLQPPQLLARWPLHHRRHLVRHLHRRVDHDHRHRPRHRRTRRHHPRRHLPLLGHPARRHHHRQRPRRTTRHQLLDPRARHARRDDPDHQRHLQRVPLRGEPPRAPANPPLSPGRPDGLTGRRVAAMRPGACRTDGGSLEREHALRGCLGRSSGRRQRRRLSPRCSQADRLGLPRRRQRSRCLLGLRVGTIACELFSAENDGRPGMSARAHSTREPVARLPQAKGTENPRDVAVRHLETEEARQPLAPQNKRLRLADLRMGDRRSVLRGGLRRSAASVRGLARALEPVR